MAHYQKSLFAPQITFCKFPYRMLSFLIAKDTSERTQIGASPQ